MIVLLDPLVKQKVSFVFRLTIDLRKMPLGKLRVVCIRNISKTKTLTPSIVSGTIGLQCVQSALL